MNLYTYRLLEVVRVVDGDTYDLILDVGFHQRQASRFRLLDYDTPEIYWHGASETEKEAGQRAVEFVKDWLSRHEGDVLVRTEPDPDSFGRWLVELSAGGVVLGERLLEADLATEWPTRWREVHE